MKRKSLLKVMFLAFVFAAVTMLFTGCGGNQGAAPAATPAPATPAPDGGTAAQPPADADGPVYHDYTIRILTVSHSGDLIAPNHPAIRQLEELTGYRIEVEMNLNANWEEQMNLRLAGGDLPGIVVILGNNLPIVQAAQGGAFWDLTDHIPQWEYLSMVNPAVMNNISIAGRHFGIYRERPVGRPGIVYRSDWLEYLGMPVPSTLDELFDAMVAMTEATTLPNSHGDTFGMAWTGGHMGPFHDIAVFHGAPNRWEVVNGTFVPWFEHPAFAEAMYWSRALFEAGAINQDFAALPTSDWAPIMRAGQTGFFIDVSDEARRTATGLRDQGFMDQEELDDGALVWVMGTVANAQGERRIRAHAGHAGYVAISTIGAPTDEDLWHHLNFLNYLNSPLGQLIVAHGAEGYNWEIVDGRLRQIGEETGVEDVYGTVEGLNQFMMLQNLALPQYGVNSREDAITEVQLENLNYAIHDPSLALMSETWTAHAGSLNRLIDDAIINFVMGNIDMDGFRAEVARWYAEGGQDAINEFSAAYAAR